MEPDKMEEIISGIKKYIFQWDQFFNSPKVGQPPAIDDLRKLVELSPVETIKEEPSCLTEQKKCEIFHKHFDKFRSGLFKASLDHYLETGKLSGSLFLSVKEMAEEYNKHEPVSKQEPYRLEQPVEGGIKGTEMCEFQPDPTTSSATKCLCGREKWEHGQKPEHKAAEMDTVTFSKLEYITSGTQISMQELSEICDLMVSFANQHANQFK